MTKLDEAHEVIIDMLTDWCWETPAGLACCTLHSTLAVRYLARRGLVEILDKRGSTIVFRFKQGHEILRRLEASDA